MEQEIKKFVIYKITNTITQKIYVGAHITNNVDDKYMGSSKHLKKDIKEFGKQYFVKEILFVFDTKEEMLAKEFEIVNKEFCYREDTYNRMIGGITGSFNYLGMTTVKNKDGNTFKVYLDDPRYLSGELISIYKGTIPVIDKYGNNFRVNKDDSRYLSGELIFNLIGKISVKDDKGNTFSVNKDDSRYLSGELQSVAKNKVTVVDKNGNTFSVNKDDSRYLSGELQHNLKNIIVVKDDKGNTFSVNKDDSRYLSGELVGWAKGRPGIKGMLGKKRTEEDKENLRQKAKLRTGKKASGFGRTFINNGEINKRVKFEELIDWENKGWEKGKKLKRTKESIINAAKKYNTKIEFRINDSKSYSYAQEKGWLSECYKHMV